MHKQFILSTLSAVLVTLCACTTDIDMNKVSKDINYNTALVIPVGTAHTSVSQLIDFLNKDNLRNDSALNTCVLWWADTLDLDTRNVHVGDFTKGKEYDTPYKLVSGDCTEAQTPGTLPAGTYVFHDQLDYDFDYDHYTDGVMDQRIDSAVIHSARLYFKIETTDLELSENAPLNIKLQFVDIKGIDDRQYQVTQNGWEISDTIGQFSVLFATDKATTPVRVTYTYKPKSSFELKTTSVIIPHIQFRIIDCDKAWGFFNRQEDITADDIYTDIPTNFFNSETFTKNRLYFTNPQIKFTFTNGIGIPMDFKLLHIKAISATGEERTADFNGSESTVIKIRKPNIEGDTSINSRIFDNTNGHTERLFEIIPEKFSYAFGVHVSKFETEWERKHWLYFPPKLNMQIEARMPFQYNPNSHYARIDTLDCDIADLTSMDSLDGKYNVEELHININYVNKLPVKGVARAYMVDSLGNVLYTSSELLIKAAPTDSEGRTTASTSGETRILLQKQDISTIWKTKKIIITSDVEADKPAEQKAYFSLDDELTIHAALFVKGGVKTSFDSLTNK